MTYNELVVYIHAANEMYKEEQRQARELEKAKNRRR